MIRTLAILLLLTSIQAQNIKFIMDHPIYPFLDRHEALGHIAKEYPSTRPYTYDQIHEMLEEISNHRAHLQGHDLNRLAYFEREFDRDFPDDRIDLPWQKRNYGDLLKADREGPKPFFASYSKAGHEGWINYSETLRLQNNGKATRGYHTDHFGIYGTRGNIAFTTQFTYYRVTKEDAFSELPDSYKEGYILEREEIKWLNWDHPTSSLNYGHTDFELGIHRQPVYWGYSPTNSSILSDNVYPLPHISWSTQLKHLRYEFIHARLSDTAPPLDDTVNVRRNISAHRVEFDITPNFEFSFNEMIIYAYRDFELAYLNPVNFLFAEEHVQGNLDNLLMALEFKWRPFPGLMTYGSWLFDELNYLHLFDSWWGNKFVFQFGATYHPLRNLPSLSLEYTAARPWTYSHQYPVNSYTSAGRVLGLADGPNSSNWTITSQWQPTPKLWIQGQYRRLLTGEDPGRDPLLSYSIGADEDGPEKSGFIWGETTTESFYSARAVYQFSRSLGLSLMLIGDGYIESGISMSW